MARKVILSDSDRQKFQKKTKRTRLVNVRSKRKYYLIVSEGAQTEPNYFNGLKAQLPRGVFEICSLKIIGTGYNTLSLANKAFRIREHWQRETLKPIDKLWVVFDKDNYSGETFQSTILQCTQPLSGIDCAWSNESFELWYLLHFQAYHTPISRSNYPILLENHFKKKGLHGFKYQKNNKAIYALLNSYGSQAMAIKNAKALENQFEGVAMYALHNPCTTVHRLVEEIINLRTEVE